MSQPNAERVAQGQVRVVSREDEECHAHPPNRRGDGKAGHADREAEHRPCHLAPASRVAEDVACTVPAAGARRCPVMRGLHLDPEHEAVPGALEGAEAAAAGQGENCHRDAQESEGEEPDAKSHPDHCQSERQDSDRDAADEVDHGQPGPGGKYRLHHPDQCAAAHTTTVKTGHWPTIRHAHEAKRGLSPLKRRGPAGFPRGAELGEV